MKTSLTRLSMVFAAALALTGCANMDLGNLRAKTVATGAAGGASAENANEQLEQCDSALGTVSLVENQTAGWYTILTTQYKLPPTSQLLRLMIQQSNCFIVVERSAAGMQAMQRERALMGVGQMRGGSNMGGGQMVASDYALSPEVIFSDRDTSNLGGTVGGILGRGAISSLVGIVAGSMRTSDASVMLTLVDNRSGVQVSASEGSARNTDFGGLLGMVGGSGGGAFAAYNRTPEGKVLAAAFMDGYNNMVRAVRNYRAQTVRGQGLGGGGRLGVDGGAAPSQTSVRGGGGESASGTLRNAQAKLNSLGYEAGVADGLMGRKTADALRAFQRDQNLPQSGRLDAATAQALQGK